MTIDFSPTPAPEPLVSLGDLDEYAAGLTRRLSGEWDEDKWTGFRTRFGVYGQKQAGVQMVRIKIPGGVVPVEWLPALAEFNRRFCQGEAHITTRQDIQTYFVPLERTAEALNYLYSNGLTTREACGNTFRNISACALSGHCPREHTDAGKVAQQLATAWIRNPLVQHMPRKVKVAVSGCATDCSGVTFHDLGFVAVERDGQKGFRVFAAGGLGSQPKPAIEVLDFITEDQLPTAMEALARIHQRYSDRVNRNAARIKFVAKRFGDDKFKELYQEEFAKLSGLAQRPWDRLDWRAPAEASVERTPMGVVPQHDGRFAVIANPVLGNLSSDQLDALATMAAKLGIAELRLTRDQNFVVPDVTAKNLNEVLRGLKSLGIAVPLSAAESTDVVSCPGTTTCRIGITNSPGLARSVLAEAEEDATARGVSVRISGCQNSCGQHHIGDFGFHGVAKKIDGKPAPHYQIHLGGEARLGAAADMAGMAGPIIPAGLAPLALRLLRHGYANGKRSGEKVRGWAERLGRDGIEKLLAPLAEAENGRTYLDWGDEAEFKGAPTLRGECAAPFASDDVLADFADDSLIQFDRLLAKGRGPDAEQAGMLALTYGARRVLHKHGRGTADDERPDDILAASLGVSPGSKESAALKAALGSRAKDSAQFRDAVAYYLDSVRAVVSLSEIEADAAE